MKREAERQRETGEEKERERQTDRGRVEEVWLKTNKFFITITTNDKTKIKTMSPMNWLVQFSSNRFHAHGLRNPVHFPPVL